MSKKFLSYKDQLKKLKKEKNIIIDIEENKAIEILKKENYTNVFSFNKEWLTDFNSKNELNITNKKKN
ncbi:hypothetical protein ACXX84_03940 [Mycoplasma sp. AC157]